MPIRRNDREPADGAFARIGAALERDGTRLPGAGLVERRESTRHVVLAESVAP